jgi:energy-coupling factor transporter ATP-binding protein EcfA2
MSRVTVSDLSYRYPGAAGPALQGVSLEVEPGEFVVLAGVSGSGKSTLLRAVAGLVPHFHGGEIGGRVQVGEMDTRSQGPGDLAAEVATLFQDPETQVVMGTVRAELAFPLENRGWGEAAVARSVEETALALGIDALLDRSTAELSGGELQRVALGATLAGRPSVVCLDEPTSQLDPVAGDELIGLLRRLNEDLELTVLLAEHRLERCLGVADRVVALDGGRVVFDGDPTSFLGWAVKAAPSLATPGARLLAGVGVRPVPGVRRARLAMRDRGLPPVDCSFSRHHATQMNNGRTETVRFDRVWHEIKNGPAILRNLSFTAKPGERIALMGRNGAGKSTLLRHAAQLLKPTRGKVHAQGRVALLLQNPNDYLVHDRVQDEAPEAALQRFHLTHLRDRHPRDLSGGERQRLALAIILGDPDDPPAVLCLDEPTRGMDRHVKDELAALIGGLSSAVIVATHDPEFAALFADRVILLGGGRIIADASPPEVLAGGTYFATETARILDGAALTPAQGVQLLRRQEVPA